MAWLAAVSPGGLGRVIASRRRIASTAALCAIACAGCDVLLGIGPLDAGPLDAEVADAELVDAERLDAGPVEGSVDAPTVDGSAPPRGDASPNADADATITNDGAADATLCESCVPTDGASAIPEAAPAYDGPLPPPGWIADAGGLYHAAGNAQQLHAVYAANDGRVWYFYVDDDETTIKTVASANLSTWVPTGDAIPLGVASVGHEGNNFSVGYANLAGTDVVHIIVTNPGVAVMHVRTTIAGGHLTPPTITTVVQHAQSCGMDGPFALVTVTGEVVDVTGAALNGTSLCDMDIFQAAANDDGGASFSPSFPMENGYYMARPGGADSHMLVALGSGDLLGAYANGASAPPQNGNYGTVSWARRAGGQWQGTASAPAIFGGPVEAGAGSPGQGGNDWSLCALGDGNIHALRHLIEVDAGNYANDFEQAVYGDGGAWDGETPPYPTESLLNHGLVLVSDTHHDHGMLAAVVGTDYVTVNVSKWDPSTGTWSGWQRATAEAARAKEFLSGTGCASEKPMIFWVEPIYQSASASDVYIIHGLDVSRFLAPDGGN
jgi:hypothetical protein